MTDMTLALFAAKKTGVTGISAEHWHNAIAFYVEPKSAGQAFWEELERHVMRSAPVSRYYPPPTHYVFEYVK